MLKINMKTKIFKLKVFKNMAEVAKLDHKTEKEVREALSSLYKLLWEDLLLPLGTNKPLEVLQE
jgi:hypothetical protein